MIDDANADNCATPQLQPQPQQIRHLLQVRSYLADLPSPSRNFFAAMKRLKAISVSAKATQPQYLCLTYVQFTLILIRLPLLPLLPLQYSESLEALLLSIISIFDPFSLFVV